MAHVKHTLAGTLPLALLALALLVLGWLSWILFFVGGGLDALIYLAGRLTGWEPSPSTRGALFLVVVLSLLYVPLTAKLAIPEKDGDGGAGHERGVRWAWRSFGLVLMFFVLLMAFGPLAPTSAIHVGDPRYSLASRNALQEAAEAGAVAEIERLVGQGHNIDAKDPLGRTPLHYAVGAQRLEAVQLLLALGADPDVRDSESGVTPLHWAVGSGDLAIIKLLAEKMQDPELQDKFGEPPITYAPENKKAEIAELLIRAHALDRELGD